MDVGGESLGFAGAIMLFGELRSFALVGFSWQGLRRPCSTAITGPEYWFKVLAMIACPLCRHQGSLVIYSDEVEHSDISHNSENSDDSETLKYSNSFENGQRP